MNSDRCGASAGSAGTATAQEPSRPKKRPGRWTRRASGRRLNSCAWLGVPEREQRDVGLAVVADLEAQLGGRGRQARLQLARARAREVVEVDALEARQPARARRCRTAAAACPRRPGSAPSRAAGGSPASVRIRNAPAPSCATTVTAARQRSDSLSQREHLGRRPRARGKRPSSSATSLPMRASAGHAPVLAAPVEPALRQPLDGLVEVLVEREVEDQLRALARILVAQPDAALRCARTRWGAARRSNRRDLARAPTPLPALVRPQVRIGALHAALVARRRLARAGRADRRAAGQQGDRRRGPAVARQRAQQRVRRPRSACASEQVPWLVVEIRLTPVPRKPMPPQSAPTPPVSTLSAMIELATRAFAATCDAGGAQVDAAGGAAELAVGSRRGCARSSRS